jgi:hypothetical protein
LDAAAIIGSTSSRGAEDFLRPGAEHDILRLDLVLRDDRRGQIRLARRTVERIASRFGKLSENRVERGLAGPERVLVAADADFVDARRQDGSGTLPRRLRLRELRLEPPRGQERPRKGHRVRGSDDPKETAA